MSKRASLSAFAARKEAVASTPVAIVSATGDGEVRTGQTLRLHKDAWRQLKLLALEQEQTRDSRVHQHDLLIEAVNDLFRKYGKPPIA